MLTSDEYNPRLIITDHFDKIKNELDIKVETIFEEKRELLEKERDEINALRDKQVNKINEIEHSNLSQWPSNFDKERYELEWADLLSSTLLNHEQKIERIKESIIKSDVILMEDLDSFIAYLPKFYLCLVPFYVKKHNLKFAK